MAPREPGTIDSPPIEPGTRPKAPALRHQFRVQVLGDFEVTDRGRPVKLPTSTWRLVALLAISGRVRRSRAALDLWPDRDDERAQANLRSTLWRLGQVAPGLVDCCSPYLDVGPSVTIDLAELMETSVRLSDQAAVVDLDGIDVHQLCSELLPDWYEDFIDEQRERVRQVRLHTLEVLGRRLKHAGEFARAMEVALAAVSQAPLRETSHQLVMEIHLAEGNVSEAIRHYHALRSTLKSQLGIPPSEVIRSTMAPWVPRAG